MKFKVGDKVRVTTRRHGADQYGDIGTVIDTEAPSRFGLVIAVSFGYDNVNTYAPHDLDLLYAAPVVKPSVASDLKLKPQSKTILLHLKRRGSITPMEALVSYGNSRLAAAIYDIRKIGYVVDKEMRKDEGGHNYARYTLAAA